MSGERYFDRLFQLNYMYDKQGPLFKRIFFLFHNECLMCQDIMTKLTLAIFSF